MVSNVQLPFPEEEQIRTRRSISLSTWTVRQDVTRKGAYRKTYNKKVIPNILVVGNDTRKIVKNSIFVSKVYQKFFGKDKWRSKLEDNALEIMNITFDSYHGESVAPEGDSVLL